MIDWARGVEDLKYLGMEIPPECQQSLESYLIRGWAPGGFLTSCLAGDMFRAVRVADTGNRKMLWAIVTWIMDNAPAGSWGSYELVEDWQNDKDGRRSDYALALEKDRVWEILKDG